VCPVHVPGQPVIIGTVALVYYIGSGKGSLDANVRSALTAPNIEKIDTTDDKKVIVKCKNGEIYQLLFDAAQQNYDDDQDYFIFLLHFYFFLPSF
jgi:hypothetical protein